MIKKNSCLVHEHLREYNAIREDITTFLNESKSDFLISSKAFLKQQETNLLDTDRLGQTLDDGLIAHDHQIGTRY